MNFTPFSQIIGQERAIAFLKGVMAREKIPHAYLFGGIAGTGRLTTALAFTRAMNCLQPQNGEGCGDCPVCRQVMSGNSPDLIVIEPAPDKQVIKIEQIRELNRLIGFRPLAGRFRVSIIRKAEAMTAEAANAFLKTLEEPPGENLLILLATEPQALLPTIVSRCQKVLFRPIPPELIESWLVERRAVEQEQARVLSMLSAGSLGEALRMLESEFLERRQQNLLRLTRLAGLSREQALAMAFESAREEKKKGDRYAETGDRGILDLFNVWQSWYRDLLVIKVGGAEGLLMNQDFSNKLKKTAGSFTIEALLEGLQVLEKAQKDLLESHNLDLTMENSVLALKRLHGCKE